MLSRFVEEGSKIELRALQRGLEEKGAESTAIMVVLNIKA